jgi:hypothetical protein
MTEKLAVQPDNQPTNKLQVSSEVGPGVASVVCAAIATYGLDAFNEIWPQIAPNVLSGPNASNLIAMVVITVAGYFAGKTASRSIAYRVLDRANIPVS